MNRSKIEWCDHSWNPITGCRHKCGYCYAERIATRFSGDVRLNKMAKKDYSTIPAADGGQALYVLDTPMMNETGNMLMYPFGFEPTFHRYRMQTLEKLKMGNNVFVGAMSDIFGTWVPDEWIREVFGYCMGHPIHNYLFLTKNPRRYMQYGVPVGLKNLWYGTSITRESEMDRINYLPEHCRTYVSLEPLLEDLKLEKSGELLQDVDWIIMGAETGRRKGKIVPAWEWIGKVLFDADNLGIPVFMKDSLIEIVGEVNMRRDFPEQLKRSEISPKMEQKLYGNCASCNSHTKKSNMIALLARSRRGEQPKQFGHMCKDCFKQFCEDFNLEIPDLEGLVESITIRSEEGEANV